jgi:hypothetical protein
VQAWRVLWRKASCFKVIQEMVAAWPRSASFLWSKRAIRAERLREIVDSNVRLGMVAMVIGDVGEELDRVGQIYMLAWPDY